MFAVALVAFAGFTMALALEKSRVVGTRLPIRQRITAHILLRLMRVAQWADRRWGR